MNLSGVIRQHSWILRSTALSSERLRPINWWAENIKVKTIRNLYYTLLKTRFEKKPWENKCNNNNNKKSAPKGPMKTHLQSMRTPTRQLKLHFLIRGKGKAVLTHLRSSIMIKTYCLLKTNFRVSNYLQVYQGLKLALEKGQWKKLNNPK